MYIYPYMIYIYSHNIYTVLYTYIWLHIHNLTSNQCTCTHWLYIPAWLLCLLRAVFWPGTSGSYVLSILGTSSVCDSDYIWLALWLATCCWWTKSGKQFGRFSHKNFIPSTVLSHICIYIYVHIHTYSKSPVSILDTHQSLLLRRCPLHHRGGAGSVPHLCHRHVDRNVLDVWAFQISSFEVLSKEFSKKQINWFGFKSFGIIFLDTFFWFAIERPKNCQPPNEKSLSWNIIESTCFFLRCLSGEYICYILLRDSFWQM